MKIKSEHQDKIDDFKKTIFAMIKNAYKAGEKELAAYIVILALSKKEEEKPIIGFMPVSHFMANRETKDILAEIVPMHLESMEKNGDIVLCTAFISESWMAPGKGKKWDGIIPSDHPERKEIIMAHFETAYSSEMYSMPMFRDDKDNITIGDEEYMSGENSGRFSKFFRKTILNKN